MQILTPSVWIAYKCVVHSSTTHAHTQNADKELVGKKRCELACSYSLLCGDRVKVRDPHYKTYAHTQDADKNLEK